MGNREDWETITGLIDDVDAFITEAHFGSKDEYSAKVAEAEPGASPVMLLITVASPEGETLGQQGFSCGGGWIVEDEGARISHPTGRKKIVKSSVYGQLINRVMELQVPIQDVGDGSPLSANSWVGLGFHWNQEEHATLEKDKKKSAMMPTAYLGYKEPEAQAAPAPVAAPIAAPAKPAVAAAPKPAAVKPAPAKPAVTKSVAALSDLEKKLAPLAKVSATAKAFQQQAMKIPDVPAAGDAFLARVLDDGPDGLYETLKKSA